MAACGYWFGTATVSCRTVRSGAMALSTTDRYCAICHYYQILPALDGMLKSRKDITSVKNGGRSLVMWQAVINLIILQMTVLLIKTAAIIQLILLILLTLKKTSAERITMLGSGRWCCYCTLFWCSTSGTKAALVVLVCMFAFIKRTYSHVLMV